MRFYIFQMSEKDAFWFMDLCKERADYQIGPIDTVSFMGITEDGKIRYELYDTLEVGYVDLTKEENKRLEKYL